MPRSVGGYSNKGAARRERRLDERQARSADWARTHSGSRDPDRKEEDVSGSTILSMLKGAVAGAGEAARSKLRSFTATPFHVKANTAAKLRREQKKTRHSQRRARS